MLSLASLGENRSEPLRSGKVEFKSRIFRLVNIIYMKIKKIIQFISNLITIIRWVSSILPN